MVVPWKDVVAVEDDEQEYLGVPEATLRWWRSRGKRGPKSYALSPRHVVYDLVDLDAWVAAQKENTERGGEE